MNQVNLQLIHEKETYNKKRRWDSICTGRSRAMEQHARKNAATIEPRIRLQSMQPSVGSSVPVPMSNVGQIEMERF